MDTSSTTAFSAADVLANLYAAYGDISSGNGEEGELLELNLHYSKLTKDDIIALANELAIARQIRPSSTNGLKQQKTQLMEEGCILGAIRAINAAGNEWDRELCRLFCHLCLAQILMFTAKPTSKISNNKNSSGDGSPPTTLTRVKSFLGDSARRSGSSFKTLEGEGLLTLEMDNNTLSSDGIRCLAGYFVGEKEVSIVNGERIREEHLGADRGRLIGNSSKYLQHSTEQAFSQALRSHLNTIQTLELAENQMMDLGCYCLSALIPHCRGLEKLSLVTNQLTGKNGVVQLSKSLQDSSLRGAPSMLTHLRLDYNDLGDAGATCIAEAAALYLPNLRRLGLSDNGIGDEGAKSIAKFIIGNPSCTLEYINLSVNKIGTPGFIAIADAFSCRMVPSASRKAILETYLSLQGNEDCASTRATVFRSVQDIISSLGLKAGVNIVSLEHQHLAGTPLVIGSASTSVLSSTAPSVNPNLLDIDLACNTPTGAGRFYIAAMASQFKYLMSLDLTSSNLADDEMDMLAVSMEAAHSHPLTCGLLKIEWYNNPMVKPETEQRLGEALEALKTLCMSSDRGEFVKEIVTRSTSSNHASPQRPAPSTSLHPVTIATAVGTALTAIAVCFLVMRHKRNFR
jgi:hypothetical protein